MAQIGTIIILVLILVIFGCIAYAVYRVKNAIRSFSRAAFGTDSLRKGLEQVEEEYVATPKSVSAMTSLYLPNIKREFPEFQYDEMKVRAENVLTSYLMSITAGDASRLTEGSRELKDQLEMYITQLKAQGEKERYESIKLHRTEISDYKKRNGRCTITFQTALQYRYSRWDERNQMKEDIGMTQERFNVEVVYIQDRSIVEDERDLSLGINCPNCGAPVSGLGSKVCEYCGTPVVELNIYAWTFHKVSKL